MAKLSRYRRANEFSEVVPSGVIPARGSVGARLDTNTNAAGDSLSPRRRSGERGFQESATIRWNEPLSPALSPLVPRRGRGHFSNGGCIKMGPWADEMTDTSLTGTGRW